MEEEEEEEPESVRGAALYGPFSTGMLGSGDPRVSGLLGHVSTVNTFMHTRITYISMFILSFFQRFIY